MDNLEDETQETLGVTAGTTTNNPAGNSIDFDLHQNVTTILSVGGGGAGGILNQDFDDSVILIQPRIDVVDLTTSPSTSTSAGTGVSGSGLIKPKIEDPSNACKDNTTSSLTENPSTSTGVISADGVSTHTNANTNATSNLLECPICLQTCIHPARLPCGHIFCFLCVKGVAYKNRRCAMCRREIPPEFLDHPQLVNGIEDICTTKATDDGYQWFYEGRNGGWWAYDKRTALEIEEVFQTLQQQQQQQQQLQLQVKKQDEEKAKVEANVNIDVKSEIEENPTVINNPPHHMNRDYVNFQNNIVDGQYGNANDGQDDNANHPSLLLDDQSCTYNIQICGSMYTLDFKNMIQYPQAMAYRKRKICRAKGLPAKGVAGIVNSTRPRYRNRRRPYDVNSHF